VLDPASLKIVALVDNDVMLLNTPSKNSTVEDPFKYTRGVVVDTVFPKFRE
jgi:hypothetical protein